MAHDAPPPVRVTADLVGMSTCVELPESASLIRLLSCSVGCLFPTSNRARLSRMMFGLATNLDLTPDTCCIALWYMQSVCLRLHSRSRPSAAPPSVPPSAAPPSVTPSAAPPSVTPSAAPPSAPSMSGTASYFKVTDAFCRSSSLVFYGLEEDQLVWLLITALLSASKWHDDQCFNNSEWAKEVKVTLDCLNRLEADFVQVLEFSLDVTPCKAGQVWRAVLELFPAAVPSMQSSRRCRCDGDKSSEFQDHTQGLFWAKLLYDRSTLSRKLDFASLSRKLDFASLSRKLNFASLSRKLNFASLSEKSLSEKLDFECHELLEFKDSNRQEVRLFSTLDPLSFHLTGSAEKRPDDEAQCKCEVLVDEPGGLSPKLPEDLHFKAVGKKPPRIEDLAKREMVHMPFFSFFAAVANLHPEPAHRAFPDQPFENLPIEPTDDLQSQIKRRRHDHGSDMSRIISTKPRAAKGETKKAKVSSKKWAHAWRGLRHIIKLSDAHKDLPSDESKEVAPLGAKLNKAAPKGAKRKHPSDTC